MARRKKDQFWEMRVAAGPYDDNAPRQIFKCTSCGAETQPKEGWNGEPNRHLCKPGCPCKSSDWKPGAVTAKFRRNFDRIFPEAPAAGL
jgi:hypothetical protein